MTISSTVRKAGPFSGTGVQTAFPFSFKVFAADDVLVVQADPSGVEVGLVLGTDYTATLNPDQDANPGGSVAVRVAPGAGALLTIGSAIPATQGQSIPNNGGFYPRVIEQAFDKLTIVLQQTAEALGRGVRFPFSDPGAGAVLPIASIRAGKFFAFDASGNPTAASGTGADAGLRTDIAASTGAGLTGWIRTALGAVGTNIGKWINRQPPSVFDFLNDDQIADVQANAAGIDLYGPLVKAIAAAGSGTLRWPAGTYLTSATLVQPTGQRWQGEGGQRVTTIKKGFNGDLVSVGDKGEIYDINLDGVGATYTGRGFYVPAGFSQRLERCRAQNCKAPALEYAANVGGGSHVSDFEGNTIDQTAIPAIKLGADVGPSPKFFDGIWLSGGLFDLTSGGNGSSLTNFYIRNFITSGPIAGGSVLMHIANGRVASISDTTTISGSDLTFTGVAFSGPVHLDQAQGMRFAACSFGGGITENGATCNSNEYSTGGQYVPTWTQDSGAQPAIGNGTLLCEYSRNGKVCTVNFRLVIGSTTTTGNSGPGYQFSLPFTATPDINQRGMFGNVYDTSAETDFVCNITIPSNTTIFTVGRNGGGIRDGVPIVWAEGDTVDAQFTYIVR